MLACAMVFTLALSPILSSGAAAEKQIPYPLWVKIHLIDVLQAIPKPFDGGEIAFL